MISRRKLFGWLTALGAIATLKMPAGQSKQLLPLIPMDGRWIRKVDYPDLARILLEREASRLEFLSNLIDDTRALRLLSNHVPVESRDRTKVRVPKARLGTGVFDGFTEKYGETYAIYNRYIQALDDGSGDVEIGEAVITRSFVGREEYALLASAADKYETNITYCGV